MSSANNNSKDTTTTSDDDNDMDHLTEAVGTLGIGDSKGGRRMSQASMRFFQNETSTRNLSLEQVTKQLSTGKLSLRGSLGSSTSAGISTRNIVAGLAGLDGFSDSGLIGADGKVRDEYILQRQSVNRPATLTNIPLLCDLTTASSITEVDGWVFTMLITSGFAKMSSKIHELNTINVFPIADGDTGANMKVCLKLPTRNLLINPSDNILIAVSNMAADVLLNGQGNSGTILSHFFVSLAEEVRDMQQSSLTVNEFASCLANAGHKMDSAVSNPVEGTLLSVCRDACQGLKDYGPYTDLDGLITKWNDIAQKELMLTPERLVVDGVKVLEAAGVVDSGAQGFVYMVEGMHLASKGNLPMDVNMFATAQFMPKDETTKSIDVDHTVTDSKFQFCTECVLCLKKGIAAQTVIDEIQRAVDEDDGFGDSIATVKAPGKDGGGEMLKIHIHTNEPSVFFDRVQPYNNDPIFKKEKVEDMLAMRELMHGDSFLELGDAKFTIMGFCCYVLPPLDDMDELYTLPVFVVPETTQEPIDLRFVSDTDACIALNQQRHKETAIKYTTAASNPMQIKIELMAALSKGKPLMVALWGTDKRLSALGRNVMLAIDMLEPEQKDLVKVFVHGWGFYEGPFLLEAIKLAQEGATIDEAIAACKRLADHHFSFSNFMTSATMKKLLAWRPGLFPKGFTVEDGTYTGAGIPVTIREDVLSEFERAGMLMKVQVQEKSMEALQEAEIARIKSNLKPGEKIKSILISAVGRPDYGHMYIKKLKDANVPMFDNVTATVFNCGLLGVATSNWGEMYALYIVEKE